MNATSTATIDRWLVSVRRRLRARRTLRSLTTFLIGGSAAGVILLLLARLMPLGWERPTVGAAAVLSAAAGILYGLLRPLSRTIAARSADSELRGLDRVATAVESRRDAFAGSLVNRQVQSTGSWVSSRSPRLAAPMRLPLRRGAVALTLAAAVALLLVIPNRMDAVVSQRKAEIAAVKEQSEKVRELARKVNEAEAPAEVKKEIVAELEKLAARLDKTDSVDKGLEEIAKAEGALAPLQRDEDIHTKTLLSEAEKSLGKKPLVDGAEGNLSEQLDDLARLQKDLASSEANDAADRLEAIGKSLSSTDAELSQALSAAAEALRAGKQDGSIQKAAEAARQTQGRLAGQQTLSSTRAELQDAGRDLSGEGQSDEGSPGKSQASGEGSAGQKEGDTGSSTEGSQAESGSPGGRGAGSSGPEVSRSEIYDPEFGGEAAEQLGVQGDLDPTGKQRTVGDQTGQATEGSIRVPYRYVYRQWAARASRNVDTMPIPASLRSLVRGYFESLNPE